MKFLLLVYTFLLPIAWYTLAVVVLIMLPLSLIRRARGATGISIFFASYIFGTTTWFLGAACSLVAWGWWGLIIGVVLFGVGVVPLGIVGAGIDGQWPFVWSLVAMLVLTFATRLGGDALVRNAEAVE